MADISNITLPNGSSAKIKDATARTATQWLDKLNGSKNLLSIYTFERASMCADVQSDGCTVRVHGTGSGVDLTYGTFTVPETGEYSALISIRSGTVTSLYLKTGSEDSVDLKNVTTPTSMGTLTQGTVYELKTWTGTGATVDFTVSILICKTGVLESGLTDFRPPALSNAELTAKEKQNESDILTVAEYGGGINKLNPVPIFTSGQYAVYDATTNTYSETAGHLDTFPNIRFMIQACTGTTISDFTVVSTLVNSNITQNGTSAWLFTKLSTFNRLYVGHNGSQIDCKFFLDVSNLEDNQKYYLCVNITNYTHANNEPFTWKNVMVLSEEEYLNGWWHEYQPYALPNVKLTPALIECVDSGKKNLLNYDLNMLKSLNSSGTGYGFTWNNNVATSSRGASFTVNSDMTITVNTSTVSDEIWFKLCAINYTVGNTYVISGCPIGGSTSAFYEESDNLNIRDIGNSSLISVSTDTTDNVYIVIKTGANNKTLTFKPMICEKSLWDVSQKYVPYAMDNAELTNNISTFVNPTVGDITFNSQLAQVPTVQAKYITQSGKTVNIQLYLDLGTAPTADAETIIGTLTGIDAPKNLYRGFCMVAAQYYSSDFETCFVGVGTTKNLYIKPKTGITNTKYMINITYQTN